MSITIFAILVFFIHQVELQSVLPQDVELINQSQLGNHANSGHGIRPGHGIGHPMSPYRQFDILPHVS